MSFLRTKKIALASSFLLLSSNAIAVTIDYRHEMSDTTKRDHMSRLELSHRFANGFGISSEARWKAGDNKPDSPYNDTVSNGTEVSTSYLYNFNDTYSLEGGFNLDSSSISNNYRPYATGKVVFTDYLATTLRYRPYYNRVASGEGDDDKGHQLNLVFIIKFSDKFTLENDFEWIRSENTTLWDGDKEKMLYEGTLRYRYDQNWQPYISISNVPGSSTTTDERQTRYRIGVQYIF